MTDVTKHGDNETAKQPLDKDNLISDKELFEIAKETRDLEIKLFWQRTNYFLLLNSSIGAAFLYFLQRATGYNVPVHAGWIMLAFCIIGAFVCLAWVKICLGSKFWQVHWEQVLVDLQDSVGLKESRDVFSPEHCRERVKKSLEMDSCYDCWVLRKPSVSRWMYRTALFFLVVWIIAAAYSSYIIYHHAC